MLKKLKYLDDLTLRHIKEIKIRLTSPIHKYIFY
jgi:hypothetical protein